MATNIEYPLAFPNVSPEQWTLRFKFDNRRVDNPFSLNAKRVSTSGGTMELILNFPPLRRDKGGNEMIVFLNKLRGRMGTFKFSLGDLWSDPDHGLPYYFNQDEFPYYPGSMGGLVKFSYDSLVVGSTDMTGSIISYFDGKPFIVVAWEEDPSATYVSKNHYIWPPYTGTDFGYVEQGQLQTHNPVGLWRLSSDAGNMYSYRNDGLIDIAISAIAAGELERAV